MSARSAMEDLPDDVLVEIMRYLPVEDVLTCRRVCKTLCGVALHPDVWRHRRLQDTEPHTEAVLRLAPCLTFLRVVRRPFSSLISTRCAVECLLVRVHRKDVDCDADYARAIRNQESLGRLKTLVLTFDRNAILKGEELSKTLVMSTGLESFEIMNSGYLSLTRALPDRPHQSRLRCFKCELTVKSKSFVDAMLSAHAATLEVVNLLLPRFHPTEPYRNHARNRTTGPLLGRLPKLQQLRCKIIPGLEALAACEKLSDLKLSEPGYSSPVLDGVVELLRGATQLRCFRVENPFGRPGVSEGLITEIVRSPARPLLKELTVTGHDAARSLPRSLHLFPAMWKLGLLGVSLDRIAEVLDAITPDTAPALTYLEMGVQAREQPICLWLHGDKLKAFFRANKVLHIRLFCETGCPCTSECQLDDPVLLFCHDVDDCLCPEAHHTLFSDSRRIPID